MSNDETDWFFFGIQNSELGIHWKWVIRHLEFRVFRGFHGYKKSRTGGGGAGLSRM
jgi:hypothetical protein